MSTKRKGRIYTFYSYKGGVGRSMALANVAALMVKAGQKVLIVDWDLEAPGLEAFFLEPPAILEEKGIIKAGAKKVSLKGSREKKKGIVDLLSAKANGASLDWRDCLLEATVFDRPMWIITAGQKTDDYPSRVQHLNWGELFDKHGLGRYLDNLRNEWIAEYDAVLIDSRTGVTDIGDICTVLLPDILVLLFISNLQNMDGIKGAMQRATDAHKRLPVDRRRLIGVPVPARDEVYNEYDKSTAWKEIYEEELGEYYRTWLPRNVTPKDALNKLFIPYVANWSFGERLPVVENEDEIGNPASLSAAYDRLAKLLMSGLDWHVVTGVSHSDELDRASGAAVIAQAELDGVRMQMRKQRRRSMVGAVGIAVAVVVSLVLAFFVPRLQEQRIERAWSTVLDNTDTITSAGRIEALEYLNRKHVSLAGLDVAYARLRGVVLPDANLLRARLDSAFLAGADLHGANLERATLIATDLAEANLAFANLTGAYLTGANLTGADLTGADLTDAILDGAILLRTNLTGAIGLTADQVRSTRSWQEAILEPALRTSADSLGVT